MSRPARPASPETAAPEAPPEAPAVNRLAYRLDELAAAFGVSRRTIERARASGRFPRPDLTMGRMPLWRPETVRAWVERGGGA